MNYRKPEFQDNEKVIEYEEKVLLGRPLKKSEKQTILDALEVIDSYLENPNLRFFDISEKFGIKNDMTRRYLGSPVFLQAFYQDGVYEETKKRLKMEQRVLRKRKKYKTPEELERIQILNKVEHYANVVLKSKHSYAKTCRSLDVEPEEMTELFNVILANQDPIKFKRLVKKHPSIEVLEEPKKEVSSFDGELEERELHALDDEILEQKTLTFKK